MSSGQEIAGVVGIYPDYVGVKISRIKRHWETRMKQTSDGRH